jgi:molecular chaperone DnaK
VFSTASDNQTSVDVHVVQGEREMAADNKALGRFELIGIPPAPRGIPQIEVTFDIDANGILNVTAKDLGTGKEQAIKITAKSGLTEDEIKKMVRDAEVHADDDKKKRETIAARNNLDNFVYQTEKLLNESKDIPEADKKKAEEAVTQARAVLSNVSSSTQDLKNALDTLTAASHSLTSNLYEKQKGKGAGAAPGGGKSSASSDGGDDVIDADYKDVK